MIYALAEIGGDSIVAYQIISLFRENGLNLPFKSVFEYSIGHLSDLLQSILYYLDVFFVSFLINCCHLLI
jgi:hypothetical protein